MKRSISVSLLLLVVLSAIPAATNAQTIARLTLSMYAAKFVCGKADEKNGIVAPGQYFTVINVHNPNPLVGNKVFYFKRFALAMPGEKAGKISEFVTGVLEADQAMAIECENIYRHTGNNPGQFIEGYALLYSLAELDVVDVMTAGHIEVQTLHTERVPVRKLVIGRSSALGRRMLEQK
ncbi:MAG TPA: hypothetical protein VGW76_14505 [Pyrinomonadaceae bacterium]|nr:hypothetical protein [Pyrinomonadaceae bacterium]